MNALLLAGLIASGLAADTTVELQRGDRVTVSGLAGDVRVQVWDRSALEIARRDRDSPVPTVRRSGSNVEVRRADRKGRDFDVDIVLRVPRWVDLDIRGNELEVWVSGTGGNLSVRNVSGDIRVEDVTGDLALSSVEDEIRVRGARGSVTARSRGDEVRLVDVEGDVIVDSGSGDLWLEDIRASSVSAKTLDGDIIFRGVFAAGGQYSFAVHDGDAVLELPADTDADVQVSTFDGEFVSDFPVRLDRFEGGGAMNFRLGSGGASVRIEVFDGEIRLVEASTR